MAEFKIGEDQTSEDPKIEVTVTPNNPIKVGVHRFQLIVIDNDGNQSQPSITEVLVKDAAAPTARLEIRPKEVEFGRNFVLLGEGSSDIAPGRIVKYIWTRLD